MLMVFLVGCALVDQTAARIIGVSAAAGSAAAALA
jgi:hypothetical protein